MGDVVNLNKRRKARARDADAERAASNRVRFGRSRHERAEADRLAARAEAALDQLRLDPEPSPRAESLATPPAAGRVSASARPVVRPDNGDDAPPR